MSVEDATKIRHALELPCNFELQKPTVGHKTVG